jgi:hypothetical protein
MNSEMEAPYQALDATPSVATGIGVGVIRVSIIFISYKSVVQTCLRKQPEADPFNYFSHTRLSDPVCNLPNLRTCGALL